MSLYQLQRQVAQLKATIDNIYRVGTVTKLLPDVAKVRVAFAERDNLESYDLPVLTKNTAQNKDYWMPDIDEQVLCCFLPIGMEQGFIVGGFFSQPAPPPESSENVRATYFKDGTVMKYDRVSHTMSVDIPEEGALNISVTGPVNVTATDKVTVSAPEIDLGEGGLEPVVLGEKLATWITSELKPWLDNHNHIGNLGSPTSGASAGPTGAFEAGEGASGGAVYSQKNRSQ